MTTTNKQISFKSFSNWTKFGNQKCLKNILCIAELQFSTDFELRNWLDLTSSKMMLTMSLPSMEFDMWDNFTLFMAWKNGRWRHAVSTRRRKISHCYESTQFVFSRGEMAWIDRPDDGTRHFYTSFIDGSLFLRLVRLCTFI